MVSYVDRIGLCHNFSILWEIYVIRPKWDVRCMRFHFQTMPMTRFWSIDFLIMYFFLLFFKTSIQLYKKSLSFPKFFMRFLFFQFFALIRITVQHLEKTNKYTQRIIIFIKSIRSLIIIVQKSIIYIFSGKFWYKIANKIALSYIMYWKTKQCSHGYRLKIFHIP